MAFDIQQKPSMNINSPIEVLTMWVCTILITSLPLLKGTIGLVSAIFGESIEFVFRSLFPFLFTLMAFMANKENRSYWRRKFKNIFSKKEKRK